MSYNEYIWLAMIKMMKFVIKNDKNDRNVEIIIRKNEIKNDEICNLKNDKNDEICNKKMI